MHGHENHLCHVANTICTKRGKSAGVDNIPTELVQAGGETINDVLTEICNKIWKQENDLPHGLSR